MSEAEDKAASRERDADNEAMPFLLLKLMAEGGGEVTPGDLEDMKRLVAEAKEGGR